MAYEAKRVNTVPNHDENLVQFYLSYDIRDTGTSDELLINISQ